MQDSEPSRSDPECEDREVTVCDVSLRDGLQVLSGETGAPLADRLEILAALQAARLPYIEVGSFVNYGVMPAMAATPELLLQMEKNGAEIAVLVPNLRYYEKLHDADAAPRVDTVALFLSASDRYSKLNTRMTAAAAMDAARPVAEAARDDGFGLRAYLSCAFLEMGRDGEPMPATRVIAACRELRDMGCATIALSDTGGMAGPRDIERVVGGVADALGLGGIGLHLHDRYGLGIANAHVGYRAGVRIFDCSVGGIGGNKASRGAVGNIATEELVFLFESLGVSTGVEMAPLLEAGRLMGQLLRRAGGPLPVSKFALGGLGVDDLPTFQRTR